MHYHAQLTRVMIFPSEQNDELVPFVTIVSFILVVLRCQFGEASDSEPKLPPWRLKNDAESDALSPMHCNF